MPGGPAEHAGVRAGDTLVELDEAAVRTIDDVHRFLSGAPIGARVRIGVVREGRRLQLEATLSQAPEEP